MYTSTADGEFYYSDNNGDRWIKASTGLAAGITIGMNDNIYVTGMPLTGIGTTIYSGTSASNLKAVGIIPDGSFGNHLIELSDGSLLIFSASENTKIYQSIDKGVTWSKIYETQDFGVGGDVYLSRNEADQIFLGLYSGLYRSDDKGLSFVKKNEGITYEGVGGVNEVVSMAKDKNGILYRATETRIFKSVDQGESWTSIHYNLPANDWIFGGLTCGADNSLYLFNAETNNVFKLPPNSTTWKLISQFNISQEYGRRLYYNDNTATLFYPSDKSGIFKSKDDGVQWQYGDTGITELEFRSIVKNKDESLTVLTGLGYRNYKNGIWSRRYFNTNRLNDSQEFETFLFVNGDTLKASGGGADFHISKDGGSTWTTQKMDYPNYVKGIFSIGLTLYAFVTPDDEGPSAIFKSDDQGLTWNKVEINGLYTTNNTPVDIARDEANKLAYVLISNFETGIEGVYKIDLNNNTASKISTKKIYNLKVMSDHSLWGNLSEVNNHVSKKTLVTYNSATTQWENKGDLKDVTMFEITARDYIFIMQNDGLVKVSPNKGKYWKDLSVISERDYGAITMDTQGFAYAAISHDGVFKSAASLIDVTAPEIESLFPLNGSVNVDTTTELTVSFNEKIIPMENKFLNVYKKGNDVPLEQLKVSEGISQGNNTYTFKTSHPLPPGTQIELTLESASYIDPFENAFAGTTPAQWSFTTAPTSPPAPITGIDQIHETGFSIYPNPNTGISYLQTPSPIQSISITDMLGREQTQYSLNGNKLDMASMTNSLYILTVRYGTTSKTVRVCKE